MPMNSSARARPIPEETQSVMRRRLRMIRQQKGLTQDGLKACSGSSLTFYENKDISTIRLGTLNALAEEYGWTLSQMLNYLVGEQDEEVPVENQYAIRMAARMQQLPPALQEIIYEHILGILRYHVGAAEVRRVGQISKGTTREASH